MAELEVWSPNGHASSPPQALVNEKSSLCRRIEEKWDEIQVGRQGSYSMERVESLDLYCRTTSKSRVIVVCLLTPLPALTAAILVECLPLRPPSEGWRANCFFWLRMFAVQFLSTYVINCQMVRFIPGLNFTFRKRVAIALGLSLASVGTYLVVASTVGFPVPFMVQSAPISIAIFRPLMTLLVLGPALFAKDSLLKSLNDRYKRFFSRIMMLCVVFPMYKVLYEFIPAQYKGVAVVILPIWTFAAKRVIVRSTRELDDLMPVLVAFSVDFLSTLFISVAMSNSGSITLSVLFIAADIGQSLLEYREMRGQAKTLLKLLHVEDRRNSHILVNTHVDSCTTVLISMIVEAIQNSSTFRSKSLESLRLWACLPYPLPQEKIEQLRRLEKLGVYWQQNDLVGIRRNQPLQRGSFHRFGFRLIQSGPISPAPDDLSHSIAQKCTGHSDLQPTKYDAGVNRRNTDRSQNLLFDKVYNCYSTASISSSSSTSSVLFHLFMFIQVGAGRITQCRLLPWWRWQLECQRCYEYSRVCSAGGCFTAASQCASATQICFFTDAPARVRVRHRDLTGTRNSLPCFRTCYHTNLNI